jgi:ABC-2 family transporter protein
LFVFLGCYIVIMYTAVFPALNLFLTEEKTIWILRNLPLKNETIIYGKTLTLSLSFVTTLPFLAFIPIFLGLDDLLFLLWFLGFSFLAAIIIAIPLGVKYVGKKSDILLLYSIAIILFVLLSIVGAGVNLLRNATTLSILPLCLLLLLLELTMLFLSLKLSIRLLSIPFKKPADNFATK